MQALNFSPDVPSQASDYQRRPQARHRLLNADDMRYGLGETLSYRAVRQKLACAPQLPTIWEDWRLRCPRTVLRDPMPGSMLCFSAIYCPSVYGRAGGRVCLREPEQLEHLAILSLADGRYANVTRTMNDKKRHQLQQVALLLYREAFANGELH